MRISTVFVIALMLFYFAVTVSNGQWTKMSVPDVVNGNSIFYYQGFLYTTTITGLSRSSDGGNSWLPLGKSQGLPDTIRSFVRYADGDTLYASVGASGIFRSLDNGSSWAPFNDGLQVRNGVYAVLSYGGRIFAGSERGIYRMKDSRDGWIPFGVGASGQVAVLAGDEKYIYAGIDGKGLFRSSDSGSTWSHIADSIGKKNILSILTDNDVVLVGVLSSGSAPRMYRSVDNGDHWAAISGVPPRGGAVVSFTRIGSVILAGTENGVFRSTDAGITWDSLNRGFPATATIFIRGLAVDDSYLYTSIDFDGVWKLPLAQVGSTLGIEESASPYGLTLVNYPNPSVSYTSISYTVPIFGLVTLRVYNDKSEDVTTLVESQQGAGRYTMQLDVSNFPSGIYVCRLTVGSSVITRKMLVAR